MSLQGKRLRAFQDRWRTPDGRLLENTDCSVLFKDCRGLLLLRTDEWHSKLQTQAYEGALHRLDITVIQYERCFATACYCTSTVVLVAAALQFGFFNRASSDGMGRTISSFPRQSLTVHIHCEFSSRFHSDSKRIRSGFESKRRESPRIHNVFAQQYDFANFGRVFTVIRCETLSWVCTRRLAN